MGIITPINAVGMETSGNGASGNEEECIEDNEKARTRKRIMHGRVIKSIKAIFIYKCTNILGYSSLFTLLFEFL